MGRQPRNPRVEILYKSMELLAKCMNALKRLNERIEWLEAIERGETATLNEFRNSLRYPTRFSWLVVALADFSQALATDVFLSNVLFWKREEETN